MPSIKRALQDTQGNPVKRVRLSRDELEDLEKEELILKVIERQNRLDEAIAATAEIAAAAGAVSPAGAISMSDEQAQQKAEQARKLMVRSFNSQIRVRLTACELLRSYTGCHLILFHYNSGSLLARTVQPNSATAVHCGHPASSTSSWASQRTQRRRCLAPLRQNLETSVTSISVSVPGIQT